MAAPAIRGDVLEELVAGILDGGDTDSASDGGESSAPAQAFPDYIERLAFQLWAYEAGQSVGKTRFLLQERAGVDVDLGTLRRWRESGQWVKASRHLHQTLRSESRRVVQNLMEVGTVKAARWMVSAFDDPAVSDTVKAKLASSFLDRNGFPIMLRGEMVDSLNIPSIGELSSLSDAELEARIYQYSEDASAILPEPQTDERFDQLQAIERHRVVSHANATRGKA